MLFDINKLVKKGQDLAKKHNLVLSGLTILNGDYYQVTFHLDEKDKGVELK